MMLCLGKSRLENIIVTKNEDNFACMYIIYTYIYRYLVCLLPKANYSANVIGFFIICVLVKRKHLHPKST